MAIVDGGGSYDYRTLVAGAHRVARELLSGDDDLAEARVAYMITPSFRHVQAQWGIWAAGGVAVPLCLSHPPPEIEFVLDDATPSVVLADTEHLEILRPLTSSRGLRLVNIDEFGTPDASDGDVAATGRAPATSDLPQVDATRRALMIYTSGTTGRPKGVVTTHANLAVQITSLVTAWEWVPQDQILLDLPLHHLHGILNVVCCALWSGAVCEMHPAFDAETTWDRLAGEGLTLYMAVPTIYRRLIDVWDAAEPERQQQLTAGAGRLRLMVSGSAALPVPTLERWRELSHHTLLERYGMSELGMVLSNPLNGDRRPGSVGLPLPGVEVRLIDDDGTLAAPGTPGEIQVRGEQVFLEYW
ncbi:MAG: AMP-binding protein, partial [Actinomycetota bacterium]